MKKEIKILIGISAALGLATAAYLYFKNKPKVVPAAEGRTKDLLDANGNPIFPLAIGSEGDQVKTLQKYLNNSASCKAKAVQTQGGANVRMKPLFPLDEDGIFGVLTESVLQQCYGSPSVTEDTFNNMKSSLEKNNVL